MKKKYILINLLFINFSSSPSNIINTVEIPSDTNLIHIDTHDNLKFNIFSDDISSLAFFD